MTDKLTLVHWFRKGLRVHDNPALLKVFSVAREGTGEPYAVRPIFFLDPELLVWLRVGANRWRFLQQSLADLDNQLQSLNSRLYVIRGRPEIEFPRLFTEWHVRLLTFESDIEPYARQRDNAVIKLAKEHGIDLDTFCSHTLYNPELVIARNLGRAPLTYQKFLSVVSKLKVPEPVKDPPSLEPEHKPPLDNAENANVKCYQCPTTEEMILRPEELGELKFPGGETEALRRLDQALADPEWVFTFEKPKTSPNSLEPSTTVLSPYLKFGCLSARRFYHRLKQFRLRTQPPVSLEGQLLWREFYYTAGAAEPNFDRMMGNSFCLQIPWESNEAHFEAWSHGRTGYPFIDAIMRQLRQEGWILTRGDLWISWEDGQRVFEELLLDQDWALNAGNWMWLSASAFFHQFYRVYSPIAFGKRTDPSGAYIRRYVPELSRYSAKYIYEPWLANIQMQQDNGCIIGVDYPHRIVIHEDVHKRNIQRMSAAYKVNKIVRTGREPLEDGAFEAEAGPSKKRRKR